MRSQALRHPWDAIVCGGGTAGAVVAAELAAAGRRVLVLEAGPDYGAYANGGWPAELVDSATIPTTHDWGYRAGDDLPGRDLPYERARVIGGCSAHNGCTVCWGHRAGYDGWGLAGWTARELEPLFEQASARMRVRRFADEDLAPLHSGFIEAGRALGLPAVDDLDTLDGVPGAGPQPSNSPDGVRWNSAFAFLDPVRGLPGLEIRGGALVDRVLVEHGRAAGVRAIGADGPFEERADMVILAAGVYGTPAVLLRSGIGPADDLRELGLAVAADNPGVGANLHDHPSSRIVLRRSDRYRERTAAFARAGHLVPDEQAFAKLASTHSDDGAFDLHVFPVPEEDDCIEIFVANVDPRSRGTVRLASSDPAAAPLLDHGFLTDPDGRDLAVLEEGVEWARELIARPEIALFLGAEVEPGPERRGSRAVRESVVHYWHPVGSCAMGIACDERGWVHGVDGLVVADGSLFPQTPRATTNIPTVVAGLRIAAWLVG
jgi:choline dehydrogenase